MQINTIFNIDDNVRIKPLDLIGKIRGINVDRCGVRYDVKYFYSGEYKYCYFEEYDLIKMDDIETGIGFASNLRK